MAGGGTVQNRHRHIRLDNVQHGGNQHPGAQGHGFAGLQIDLNAMPVPYPLDAAAEQIDIIVRPGDMMASPEIDPVHPAEMPAELVFHGIQRAGQAVAVLFAQGMEVQAGNAVQRVRVGFQLPREDMGTDAQTRRGITGIIDGYGSLGVFGVEAKAALHLFPGAARRLDHRTETPPLGEGVEDHMIRPEEQPGHVLLIPARREGMHFSPEFFLRQTRLVRRAGAAAPQRAAEGAGQRGEGRPLGKALEGQHDFRARAPLHAVQNGRVGTQQGKIRDKAGGGPAFGLQFRKVFRFESAHDFCEEKEVNCE